VSKPENQNDVKVEERMTKRVITITPSESCQRALLMMHSAGINHLPVLDNNRLVGILTERDILRRAPEQRSAAGAGSRRQLLAVVNVGGVMTFAPETVSPEASLREAVGVMLQRKISCLPVVQSGQLVGIFTTRDAISTLLSEEQTAEQDGAKAAEAKKLASS
jgi:acetoin utilization protein AcuB